MTRQQIVFGKGAQGKQGSAWRKKADMEWAEPLDYKPLVEPGSAPGPASAEERREMAEIACVGRGLRRGDQAYDVMLNKLLGSGWLNADFSKEKPAPEAMADRDGLREAP